MLQKATRNANMKQKEKVMGLGNITMHREDEKEAGEGREAS